MPRVVPPPPAWRTASDPLTRRGAALHEKRFRTKPEKCGGVVCTSHSPQTTLRHAQPWGAGRRFPRVWLSKWSTQIVLTPSSTSTARWMSGVEPRSTTVSSEGMAARARPSICRKACLEENQDGDNSRAIPPERSAPPTASRTRSRSSVAATHVTGTIACLQARTMASRVSAVQSDKTGQQRTRVVGTSEWLMRFSGQNMPKQQFNRPSPRARTFPSELLRLSTRNSRSCTLLCRERTVGKVNSQWF